MNDLSCLQADAATGCDNLIKAQGEWMAWWRLCGGSEAGTCSCAECYCLRINNKMASYEWKSEQVVLVDSHMEQKKTCREKRMKMSLNSVCYIYSMTVLCKYISSLRSNYAECFCWTNKEFSFPSPLIHAILIVCDTEHCTDSSPAARKKEAAPATTGMHQEQ